MKDSQIMRLNSTLQRTALTVLLRFSSWTTKLKTNSIFEIFCGSVWDSGDRFADQAKEGSHPDREAMSGNPRVDKEAFGRRLKRLVNAFVKSEDNEVSGIKFLNSLFLTKFVSNNSMMFCSWSGRERGGNWFQLGEDMYQSCSKLLQLCVNICTM